MVHLKVPSTSRPSTWKSAGVRFLLDTVRPSRVTDSIPNLQVRV